MTIEVQIHPVTVPESDRCVKLARIGRDRWFIMAEHSANGGPGIQAHVELTANELASIYSMLAAVFGRGKCIACARESGDIASAFCPEHRDTYHASSGADMEDEDGNAVQVPDPDEGD